MDLDTIKTWALVALIVIGVVGILLAIIVKKIVGKVISLVIAAVLVFFLWQQRQHVIDSADQVKGQVCSQQVHFFGIDVHLPAGWCSTGK